MIKKRDKVKINTKVRRIIATTALFVCMFTTTALAESYNGDYGNAKLEVTHYGGLKRAIAETVPYESRSCYFVRLKVETFYEDGSVTEDYHNPARGGRAYYYGSYESAIDYKSTHGFRDYYDKIPLDECVLYED